MTETTPDLMLSNAYQNWYRFSRNPTAMIGLVIVVLIFFLPGGLLRLRWRKGSA